MAVALGERPELAESDGLGQAAGALDVVAEPVLDVVAELGLDPDRDGVVLGVAVVVEADVLDVRLADDLDAVAPAAAVEVVEAPLPFGEQVRGDEAASAARSPRSQAAWTCLNSAVALALTASGANAASSSAASAAAASTRRWRSATRRCAFGPEPLRAAQDREALGMTRVMIR